MANNLKDNKPPILSQTIDGTLRQLQNMPGLSLILGRVPESDVIQNSSESINNFKNAMVFTQNLTENDFIRVAPVQPGENKHARSTDRPAAYRPGGRHVASQQSGKAFTLDENMNLHVILGNSTLNWCENLYETESFKVLPSYKGPGLQESNGWVYITVGKMSDGVEKQTGPNWFPVAYWGDGWKTHKELNSNDVKAQATRICGSAGEQTTGTCCLYYKEDYYDDVAGVTWGAGDYYKCTCAKCYHCLEMARSLDMDYLFTKFVGSGPTGGTGERCQDCDLDNYPNNCGPCPCTIGTYDKFDVLLNDKFLPEEGMAKTNARIARDCNKLAGTVLCHVNLDGLDSEEREINRDYWNAAKELVFIGPQAPGKNDTKTVYTLATEVKRGNREVITGLKLKTTGRYTSMPPFPADALKQMVPGVPPDRFRTLMLPDFSKLPTIAELVGGTRVQLNTTVSYSDIQNKTSIKNFNVYALGVPMAGNRPYFDSNTQTPNSSRLTYRNKAAVKTNSVRGGVSAETQESTEVAKRNTQISTTNAGPVIYANGVAISGETVDLEIFAGNNTNIPIGFEYVDTLGDTWQATNSEWLIPTSSQSGKELDAQATDIFHVNKFSLNIPDRAKEPGFINLQCKVILTL